MVRIIDKVGDKISEFKNLMTQLFVRFPIAGALAVLNIIFSCKLSYAFLEDDKKIAGSCLLASIMSIGLSVLAGLFYEARKFRRGVAYGLQALSFIFFIGFAYVFYHWIDYNEVFFYPYFLTVFAIAALSLFVLSSSREEPRDVVPMGVFSLMTAGVASLVFAIGVSFVFFAIHELLEFKISSDTYKALWLSSLSSLFVVFTIAYGTKKERFISPKVWKVLVGYVAFPIYLILTCVMLAFCLKCAAKWSIPDGEVNRLVIVSSVLWMAFRYLTAVYDGRVFRLFNRFGSILLFPQVILQGLALWIRIDNYGFTPARYLSLAFALFMAIVAIGVFWEKRFSGRVVFLTAAAFALTLSYGPLNVVDFSVRSQIAKYEEFKARKIAGEKFDEPTKNAIMGTWEYIGGYEKSNWRYIPKKNEEGLNKFEKEWGFKFVYKSERWRGSQVLEEKKHYSYRREYGELKLDGLKVVGYRTFGLRTESDDGGKTEEIVELQGLENNVNLKEKILEAFVNDVKPTDLRLDLGDGRIAVVLSINYWCDSQKIYLFSGEALICEAD